MSETITIREVDQQKTLSNVDKLKTKKQGGGYVYWVPEEDVQTTTKHITKNGTYKAKDDDKYGYSEVTVNVPGGSGSADSSGKPNTGSPSVPGSGIAPGGPGSAVVGTDPETGNEEVVGVDEDGNIVKTTIPSAIEITKPPDDTEYNEGDTIIYDGVIVRLKKKDGGTFTSARYLGGTIPFKELIFPVKVAPEASGFSDFNVISAVGTFFRYNLPSKGEGTADQFFWSVVSGSDVYFCTREDNGMYYSAVFSRQPFVVQWSSSHYSFGNITGFFNDDLQLYVVWDSNSVDSDPSKFATPVFTYQEIVERLTGSPVIPVQWKSPYDGKTLEDTFEITVTSNSHTSERSSGTGGGGTF